VDRETSNEHQQLADEIMKRCWTKHECRGEYRVELMAMPLEELRKLAAYWRGRDEKEKKA
jgi:hypothetical protein